MGQRPNLEIDALLDVARLRTLARHLVADPLAAEDLIQDAWAAAIAGPAAPQDLGAWLAGAVRHLARRTRRGAERRARREAACARDEALPSTVDLVARSELLERVIGAVRGLDEPYRTTVLLHYVEGWTCERIARHAEVPASTVRNRLARALERLRERLDRDAGGDRSAWLSALLPLARASVPDSIASPIATLAMSTTTKLLLAAAAAGGALLAMMVPPSDRSAGALAAAGPIVPGVAPEAPAKPPASPAVASTPSGRTPLVSTTEDASERIVYGSVLGTNGEVISDGWISFADPLGDAREATLGNGAYSIVGLAPGRWTASVRCAGFLPGREELELVPGSATTRLDFTLVPSRVLRVKFVDEEGRAILDATSHLNTALRLGAIATRERPGERIHGLRASLASNYGAGVYRSPLTSSSVAGLPVDCAGLLELQASPPLWISAVLGDGVLESRLFEGGPEEIVDEIVFVLERQGLEQRNRGGVRVRVVDAESGAPLQGSASLGYMDWWSSGPALQPDGTAEFLDQIAGLRELTLRFRDHESLLRTVRVLPDQTIDLGTIALHRQRAIRGHLEDDNGRPLATALTWTPAELVISVLDIDQRIGGQSGPDGSFQLFGAGRGEVLLFAGRGELAANPIRIAAGEDTEVNAVVPRGTLVVIRPVQEGEPGIFFAVADEQGRAFWSSSAWKLRLRLVPGRYQLWTCQDELVQHVESFTVGNETLVLER